MKWYRRRRSPSPELMEALDSINRGHEQLFAAQDLTNQAREVAEALRESHRTNHFGAALEKTMMRAS